MHSQNTKWSRFVGLKNILLHYQSFKQACPIPSAWGLPEARVLSRNVERLVKIPDNVEIWPAQLSGSVEKFVSPFVHAPVW